MRLGGNGKFKAAAQSILFSKKFGEADASGRKTVVSQACVLQ
jgi:hypothetical protein